jgi:hypothetical protein
MPAMFQCLMMALSPYFNNSYNLQLTIATYLFNVFLEQSQH